MPSRHGEAHAPALASRDRSSCELGQDLPRDAPAVDRLHQVERRPDHRLVGTGRDQRRDAGHRSPPTRRAPAPPDASSRRCSRACGSAAAAGRRLRPPRSKRTRMFWVPPVSGVMCSIGPAGRRLLVHPCRRGSRDRRLRSDLRLPATAASLLATTLSRIDEPDVTRDYRGPRPGPRTHGSERGTLRCVARSTERPVAAGSDLRARYSAADRPVGGASVGGGRLARARPRPDARLAPAH